MQNQLSGNLKTDILVYQYTYTATFSAYEQKGRFLAERDQSIWKTTNLSSTVTFSSGPIWPIWLKLLGPEISLFRRNSALAHKYTDTSEN